MNLQTFYDSDRKGQIGVGWMGKRNKNKQPKKKAMGQGKMYSPVVEIL